MFLLVHYVQRSLMSAYSAQCRNVGMSECRLLMINTIINVVGTPYAIPSHVVEPENPIGTVWKKPIVVEMYWDINNITVT